MRGAPIRSIRGFASFVVSAAAFAAPFVTGAQGGGEGPSPTNILRYVMKNGRLYHALTLDETWPRQLERSTSQWWMTTERQ